MDKSWTTSLDPTIAIDSGVENKMMSQILLPAMRESEIFQGYDLDALEGHLQGLDVKDMAQALIGN